MNHTINGLFSPSLWSWRCLPKEDNFELRSSASEVKEKQDIKRTEAILEMVKDESERRAVKIWFFSKRTQTHASLNTTFVRYIIDIFIDCYYYNTK
jgi:hypothetical protein